MSEPEITTARKILRSLAYAAGYNELQMDSAGDHLYDMIAHELAEEIRSHPECEIGGYGDGILDASFMIDPEVSP